jgi:hypothetical protein
MGSCTGTVPPTTEENVSEGGVTLSTMPVSATTLSVTAMVAWVEPPDETVTVPA